MWTNDLCAIVDSTTKYSFEGQLDTLGSCGYDRQQKPFFLIGLAVWTLVGVLLALFWLPVFNILRILALPFWPSYWLVGFLLFVWALWLAFSGRRSRASFVPLLALLSVAATLLLVGPVLSRLGDVALFRWRFSQLRPRYEEITAQVPGGPVQASRTERDGLRYQADPGPPVRVVFPQPGGLLDNYEGVVYDPTGAVAEAKGWTFANGKQEFTASPNVRELFGGDIVACKHVEGDFHRCWFT